MSLACSIDLSCRPYSLAAFQLLAASCTLTARNKVVGHSLLLFSVVSSVSFAAGIFRFLWTPLSSSLLLCPLASRLPFVFFLLPFVRFRAVLPSRCFLSAAAISGSWSAPSRLYPLYVRLAWVTLWSSSSRCFWFSFGRVSHAESFFGAFRLAFFCRWCRRHHVRRDRPVRRTTLFTPLGFPYLMHPVGHTSLSIVLH